MKNNLQLPSIDYIECLFIGPAERPKESALKNNLIQKSDYRSILKHISKANLPSKIKNFFKIKDLNKILSFMAKDKKNNSSNINLVLLKKIGYPIINKEYKKNNLSKFLKNELRN